MLSRDAADTEASLILKSKDEKGDRRRRDDDDSSPGSNEPAADAAAV